MGTFYISRHGETVWNTEKRMQGHQNSPLTEMGNLQAQWLRERLSAVKLKKIYVSPLERAVHTATIVNEDRHLPMETADELKELSLGIWEGRLIHEVKEEFPVEHLNFWEHPEQYIPIDGESFESLTERVSVFLQRLSEQYPEDNLLLVTHALTIKAIVNLIQNQGKTETIWEGPSITPTSLTIIQVSGNTYTIDCIADDSHHLTKTKLRWFVEKKR